MRSKSMIARVVFLLVRFSQSVGGSQSQVNIVEPAEVHHNDTVKSILGSNCNKIIRDHVGRSHGQLCCSIKRDLLNWDFGQR